MLRVSTVAACASVASSTLYGFAIHKSTESADFVGVAEFHPADGGITYKGDTKLNPSDAYCNVAFDGTSQQYFAFAYTYDKGYQSILTIDAVSGNVTNNVTMSLPYSIPESTYDEESGNVIAVGTPPGGGADVISISPSTGTTTVLASQIGIPDIQLCEAAFQSGASSSSLGYLYYIWQPLANDSEALAIFDLDSNTTVSQIMYNDGGINGFVTWDGPSSWATPVVASEPSSTADAEATAAASAAGPYQQVLAVSYYDTRPIELVSIDPVSGNSTVLASLPDEFYGTYQGAMAYNPNDGMAYSVFIYTNQKNNSAYPVLVEFNTSASPVTVVQHWLNETRALAGIWSLDFAPEKR